MTHPNSNSMVILGLDVSNQFNRSKLYYVFSKWYNVRKDLKYVRKKPRTTANPLGEKESGNWLVETKWLLTSDINGFTPEKIHISLIVKIGGSKTQIHRLLAQTGMVSIDAGPIDAGFIDADSLMPTQLMPMLFWCQARLMPKKLFWCQTWLMPGSIDAQEALLMPRKLFWCRSLLMLVTIDVGYY